MGSSLLMAAPWRTVVVTAACAISAACKSQAIDQPTVTLTVLTLVPSQTALTTGATQQFTVSGQWSDGSTTAPAVSYSATGGSITAGGLYTAGSTAGSFRVIAVQQGGTLADTSAVTITQGGTQTYTTTFPLTENPLSEGGKWLHLDPLLTVCKSVGGRAFGTQAGSGNYDDSNCYLTGFGTNYEVEGTVWLNPSLSGGDNREVEILLRWTDDGPVRATAFGDTHANGYEVNVQHQGAYLELGRFKGANLVHMALGATPASGDRFRARIEGQRIRVWWNDVLKIDYTDADPSLQVTTGNPGIGFYVSNGTPNTDYGFDAVTVTALP